MPIRPPGGSGGGGGGAGFALGPVTNTFNAATQAAGIAARDAYATANVDWLAQYDANGALMVRVTWPIIATSAAFYVRAAMCVGERHGGDFD